MMWRTHTTTAFDGTTLGWYEAGRRGGTALVIVNGPGAAHDAWNGLVEAFGAQYRIVAWDYRGSYRSARPTDRDTLGVDGHVADLERVLEAAHVERAVFIGWSLGVQVLLEFYRQAAERFIAIVSVNGTYGHPFTTPAGSAYRSRIRTIRDWMEARGELVEAGINLLAHNPTVFRIARAVRLLSPMMDRERLAALADAFSASGAETFKEILTRFATHDASDVLPNIHCPVLIFAGKLDPVVPAAFSERMAELIPASEILIVPIGSHYIPIEFAEYLNLRVEAFLESNVAAHPSTRAAAR